QVDVAQPRIGLIDRTAGVVQNSHARRIFEQQRAIVATQLAGVAPERRDLDEARSLRQRRTAASGLHHQRRDDDDDGRDAHDSILSLYRRFVSSSKRRRSWRAALACSLPGY